MFQNSFQGGTFFQLFDPKNIKERERPIYKVANPSTVSKIFDKTLKCYVLDIQGSSNRMQFPRQQKQDLYLLQQHLVLQVWIPPGSNFGLEMIISDHSKTRRRIIFSHTAGKPQKKLFFVKIGSQRFRKGIWINLCLDLWSFIQAFKGQSYRSLDQIIISGSCQLRKVYTTKSPLLSTEGSDEQLTEKQQIFIPKHFHFPSGIAFCNQNFAYQDFFQSNTLQINQLEPSFKNTNFSNNLSSNMSINNQSNIRLKQTKKDFSTPKVQPLKSHLNQQSSNKRFLAHTNTTQMMTQNQLQQQLKIKNQKPQQSVQKRQPYTTKQILLTDAQQMLKPGLNLSSKITKNDSRAKQRNISIEKKTIPVNGKTPLKKRQKLQITKVNPWRPQPLEKQPKRNEQEQVNQEIQTQDRDVKSAHTTVFKKKNVAPHRQIQDQRLNTKNKIQNTYSDSQYFELSQKFSTITDPKFFKPQTINKISNNLQHPGNISRRTEESQIQQAIEMQVNSITQSVHKQKRSHHHVTDHKQLQDSKIMSQSEESEPTQGFMQQQLRKMMGDLQRPYTPPIHNSEQPKLERKASNQSRQVELVYDTVLNCYFDYKTNTYYELKP